MCIPNMFSTTVVMATSDAGSGHWSQLHHVSGHPTMRPALARRPPVTDSVVVTTTTNTGAHYVSNTDATHNTLGLGHGGGTGTGSDAGAGHLPAVDGPIGKSGRKRSRASRRAPTTLLNTDTKNFRALVQQFTGVSSSSPLISPALDVSAGCSPAEDIGFTLHHGWPSSATGEFYQQQQPQEFMFPTGHDQFFHMFNNQQRSNSELSDGYMQGNISTQMMMRQIQGEHTNSHGYFS